MTLPKFENVTFTIECHCEETRVEDHFELDKMHCEGIYNRLENGDIWAWCTVEVIAEFEGCKGSDFLGCCSYHDETDFKTGGYWEDMKGEAFRELVINIYTAKQKELGLELAERLAV